MNNLKKTFLVILIFVFTILQVFSEVSIELVSSDSEISLEDSFEIEIKLNSDYDFTWGEVKIMWLENFYKTSQKNYSQITSINWETKQIQTLKLWFYPNEVWDFVIWPASIWEWTWAIVSNTIKIKVTDKIKEDEISSKTENINNNLEKINKLELKDIKNFKYSIFDFNFIFVLIILFLVLLYFYLKNLNNKDSSNFKLNNNNLVINSKEDLIVKLKKLKRLRNKLNKNEFYEKLNIIFRDYFDFLWLKWSKTKTFDELSKNIKNENILSIFKESYYNEFNSKEDSIENREKIINEFIKQI